MPTYLGQLNVNEVVASLFNMILSQRVFADNISDTKSTLVDLAKVDGGLYGDTKLYYATNVLKSVPWENDKEAKDLLKLHRPQLPKVQAVTVDQFRLIACTIDNYMTKRAFSDEGAFSAFNSQSLAWMDDTKRVYDATYYNSFIGTHEAGLSDSGYGAAQQFKIVLPAEPSDATEVNVEAYNRIVAQTIATSVSDLIVDLEDVTRDYNDYGFLRSYRASDIRFVWNSSWVNRIRKLDVPTIFNKDDLIDKFAEHTLPSRYFGNVNKNSGTTGATNITIRSLVEIDFNEVDMNNPLYDQSKHIFPGDLWPVNTAYEANETYSQDDTIIFKAYHKECTPYLTAFTSGNNFYNPRSLTDTHYLIWGFNTLEHLMNYPFITAKAVYPEA